MADLVGGAAGAVGAACGVCDGADRVLTCGDLAAGGCGARVCVGCLAECRRLASGQRPGCPASCTECGTGYFGLPLGATDEELRTLLGANWRGWLTVSTWLAPFPPVHHPTSWVRPGPNLDRLFEESVSLCCVAHCGGCGLPRPLLDHRDGECGHLVCQGCGSHFCAICGFTATRLGLPDEDAALACAIHDHLVLHGEDHAISADRMGLLFWSRALAGMANALDELGLDFDEVPYRLANWLASHRRRGELARCLGADVAALEMASGADAFRDFFVSAIEARIDDGRPYVLPMALFGEHPWAGLLDHESPSVWDAGQALAVLPWLLDALNEFQRQLPPRIEQVIWTALATVEEKVVGGYPHPLRPTLDTGVIQLLPGGLLDCVPRWTAADTSHRSEALSGASELELCPWRNSAPPRRSLLRFRTLAAYLVRLPADLLHVMALRGSVLGEDGELEYDQDAVDVLGRLALVVLAAVCTEDFVDDGWAGDEVYPGWAAGWLRSADAAIRDVTGDGLADLIANGLGFPDHPVWPGLVCLASVGASRLRFGHPGPVTDCLAATLFLLAPTSIRDCPELGRWAARELQADAVSMGEHGPVLFVGMLMSAGLQLNSPDLVPHVVRSELLSPASKLVAIYSLSDPKDIDQVAIQELCGRNPAGAGGDHELAAAHFREALSLPECAELPLVATRLRLALEQLQPA